MDPINYENDYVRKEDPTLKLVFNLFITSLECRIRLSKNNIGGKTMWIQSCNIEQLQIADPIFDNQDKLHCGKEGLNTDLDPT